MGSELNLATTSSLFDVSIFDKIVWYAGKHSFEFHPIHRASDEIAFEKSWTA